MKDFKEFINENKELIFSTHKALCLIPAPSHLEQKRAALTQQLTEVDERICVLQNARPKK